MSRFFEVYWLLACRQGLVFWEGEDALVGVGGVAGKGDVCGYGVG